MTVMTPEEVRDALKLNQLKDKLWNIVPSCATTGEGLLDGLVSLTCCHPSALDLLTISQAWLSNNIKSPPQPGKK